MKQHQRLNRFLAQFIRDGHVDLKKKFFDIVMQIYGHEGLVENEDLADTAHCSVFHLDFTRLNHFPWKYIAYRKLFNPFKHAEFLLVFTLEMLVYSFQRPMSLLCIKLSEYKHQNIAFYILWFLACAVTILGSFVLNLSANLITGIARRFLAPVRYTIRPALEMADQYPKSFLFLLITAGVLTTLALTGGLPLLIVGSQWLAYTALTKFVVIGFATSTLCSFLIKGFNVACDVVSAVKNKMKRPKPDDLENAHNERERNDNNVITIRKIEKEPTLQEVEEYKIFPLLLIMPTAKKMWVYGSCNGEKGKLTELTFDEAVNWQFYRSKNNSDFLLYKSADRNYRELFSDSTTTIFRKIKDQGAHDFKKEGSTDKMTELLHRLPVDKVEVRSPKNEDFWHQAALFFGAERAYAYCHPRVGMSSPRRRG